MAGHFRERGWVGITPEVAPDGVISVAHVFTGSPAEEAGVLRRNIVRGINGVPHDGDPTAFRSVYDSFRPGIVVVFDLERDGDPVSAEVLVAPIPEDLLEQWILRECP